MAMQARAERTRGIILDAAAAEFDAHGFAGARLDRIVERTGLTKGAVYFHFRSKLDLAEMLVADKYALWPQIISELRASGMRGLAAAEAVTVRVAATYANDSRVRAAMKLSQTVLPPTDDPYKGWTRVIQTFLIEECEDRKLQATASTEAIARTAVEAFFGAYRIADEMGHLYTLQDDARRLWRVFTLLLSGQPMADSTESGNAPD